MTRELIEPVAWRYRYLHPGRVNHHWIVRQSPAYSSEACSSFVAVEAEPLYTAATVQSLSERIDVLEGERDRLESALRIELWNERMRRGGKQDIVIGQINKEIASIKAPGRGSLIKEGNR